MENKDKVVIIVIKNKKKVRRFLIKLYKLGYNDIVGSCFSLNK